LPHIRVIPAEWDRSRHPGPAVDPHCPYLQPAHASTRLRTRLRTIPTLPLTPQRRPRGRLWWSSQPSRTCG
jgi:hypothetical protein